MNVSFALKMNMYFATVRQSVLSVVTEVKVNVRVLLYVHDFSVYFLL